MRQKAKVRLTPSSFSDIIFGLSLSIGSLTLVQRQVQDTSNFVVNMALCRFSFALSSSFSLTNFLIKLNIAFIKNNFQDNSFLGFLNCSSINYLYRPVDCAKKEFSASEINDFTHFRASIVSDIEVVCESSEVYLWRAQESARCSAWANSAWIWAQTRMNGKTEARLPYSVSE